ncbi:hypothetical protein Patl1_09140 [Pistacia atlantica]|uniref:Uncharacterized protein n=1 Tax=Pistacia atlantica TaxID=434234 RepID=A0ACC1AEK4_9ROSI|nr:hypothetical protein Patl1_09140 [Pistacia atlantica]
MTNILTVYFLFLFSLYASDAADLLLCSTVWLVMLISNSRRQEGILKHTTLVLNFSGSLRAIIQKLADALVDTVASLDKFEQGIKDCLEI